MNETDSRGPSAALSRARYDGRQRTLIGIVAVNTILTLITIGFYRFWGTTRIRRYVWGHTSLDGETFEYTGTGRELFFGFLIAAAILAPLSYLADLAGTWLLTQSEAAANGLSLLKVVGAWFLIFVALYRARRYRLRRTQWRAIRAGQSGSSLRYAALALSLWALTILTAGLMTPYRRVRMAAFRTNNTWFGDRRFAFDGRARPLMRAWLRNWLLFVPTLGLSYFWYRAAEGRYFADRTRIDDVSFGLTISGGRLATIFLPYLAAVGLVFAGMGALQFWLMASTAGTGNSEMVTMMAVGSVATVLVLILVLPMLYYGLVMHRLANYLTRSLDVRGTLDLVAIAQAQDKGPGLGEGLAGALNVGDI